MGTTPAWTLTANSITLVLGGKTYSLQKGDGNFDPVKSAILAEDWEALPSLFSAGETIEKWAKGDFQFREGCIFYKDSQLPSELNERMIQMAEKGENPTFLMRFWERLQNNPSHRSVNQLYAFLNNVGIPIDEEGCILAYKSVRADLRDWHTGKMVNTIGETLTMPRNRISDDPRVACHEGLHVGALKYASNFHVGIGQRIIIVQVDPADVVCVPYDHEQQKMRVCRYKVIGYHAVELPSTSFTKDVSAVPDQNWSELDALDDTALGGVNIDVLRTYARQHLKIVGANKIPGGKAALLERILKIRGH